MAQLQIQVQMPSAGDMVLVGQDGGVLTLEPVYYGNECMGPFISVIDPSHKPAKIVSRHRIVIRPDGKITLKTGSAGA